MSTSNEIAASSEEASQTTTRNVIAIVVLIPAHNEADKIRAAVTSVFTQSVCSLSYVRVIVLVVVDNCTDNTGEIVREMQRQWPDLYLAETQNNRDKKAGALNYGFMLLSSLNYEFTFTMDADVVLDPDILLHALEEIREEDGGICCRVGLLPLEKECFEVEAFAAEIISWLWIWWELRVFGKKILWLYKRLWKRLWWAFQNVEYAIAQSETVERFGWANCLCGPGTLFRTRVLKELQEKNGGEIWRGASLVEDYYLTKEIQRAGYKTRVGHTMFAYTDVPIGFRNHWLQRTRWYGGDIRTWFDMGINRYTMFESPDMGLQVLWFSCRITLILTAIHILLTGFIYIDQVSFWLLWLPVFTSLLNLYRFRYVPYKTVLQLLLVLFLVYEVYAVWYGVVLIGSFYTAYTIRKSW